MIETSMRDRVQHETIEYQWQDFCLKCFGNLDPQQYVDLRRTFYGGAVALYGLLMQHLDSGDEITDHDVQMMHNLRDEILRFNEDVKAGKA